VNRSRSALRRSVPVRLLAIVIFILWTLPSKATAPLTEHPVYIGEISNPAGIAPLYPAGAVATADGTRYIADSGGNRIVRIDPTGFRSEISRTGWNRPRAIALDTEPNRLWVTDTTDNEIVLITTAGQVLSTFGGAGAFRAPFAVAVDSSGVYVADTYNQRIKKISRATGASLWTQTSCQGLFSRPRGIAVGSDGKIYVADTDHGRIAVLQPETGACIRAFGRTGGGPGEFRGPVSLASDGNGGLWVAERKGYRAQHVNNDGRFLAATSTSYGIGTAQFRAPSCVYLDGSVVGVCDVFAYRILRFTDGASGAVALVGQTGGVPPALGGFNNPFGVVFGPAGELYVTDMFNHRVQKFRADGSAEREWGGFGLPPGAFNFPRGITLSADGETVVVTNSENDRIDLFTATGGFIRSVQPIGTRTGWPHQTALATDGTFWIADTNNNRVLHLAADGAVLLQFDNNGGIRTPRGIALDRAGYIYVASSGNQKVEKFTATGQLMATLATRGTGATNVKQPWNLAVYGELGSERLLITDAVNNRVVILTTSGSPVATFGASGSGGAFFNSPRGVAVNPVTGVIAVTDFYNNRISLWH
jgi:tripartite motif-containing protein 71